VVLLDPLDLGLLGLLLSCLLFLSGRGLSLLLLFLGDILTSFSR